MRWPPIWANRTRCPRSRSPSRSATTAASGCVCGWTGSAAADTDEWREHLADAILEALGRVE